MELNLDNLSLLCPHCQKLITPNNFHQNEQSLGNFQAMCASLIGSQMEDYRKELFERWSIEHFADLDEIRKSVANAKDNEINRQIIEFNEVKSNLILENRNLQAKLYDMQLIKDKEMMELRSEQINDFNAERNELLNKIHDLEMENARNKLIDSRVSGKNLEENFAEVLSEIFLFDDVKKITVIGQKADFIQTVKNESTNSVVGSIVYELKNTLEWNQGWERKFIDDMNRTDARYGVIAATSFAKMYGKKVFAVSSLNSNVYLTSHENVVLVSQILRTFMLIEYQARLKSRSPSEANRRLQLIKNWKDTSFLNLVTKMNAAFDALEKVYLAINNQIKPFRKTLDEIKIDLIGEINQQLSDLLS